ncbi:MAG: hypothetical protein L3K09_01845 [Thermoplasmata archaeon]|nr:hypothetical protein [Thermoplasmata archaeon]
MTPVIATVIMVLIGVATGVVLWSFKIPYPASQVRVSYIAENAGKSPVWGDPTDCVPYGNYVMYSNPWWNAYFLQCQTNLDGNYSTMNSTQISFTAHSPQNIPLSEIQFTFECNGTTALVSGSLAAMTWFPGVSSSPAPNAPHLGWCGTFHAGGFGGGAFGTLYNRLGIFVPLSQNSTVLQDGDTFILYIHTAGSVYDPFSGGPDTDDFHGAPSWCFTVPGDCTIYLTYTGVPQTLLATIPLIDVSGAGE